MHTFTCQYCEAEIGMDEVEKEGGCCPECGMLVGAGAIPDDDDDDDDFDDFDDDDDFNDED